MILGIKLWFKLSVVCMKLLMYAVYYTMLMLIECGRVIMSIFNKLFMSGNVIERGRVNYEFRRY